MKKAGMTKKGLATLGLLFITFLAAIQYVFLRNVPDTVSTFSFVCITNVIGAVLLFAARAGKIIKIKKKTLLKGAFFAVLLTGFNFFVLLGSRQMDSVVVSSIVSLYFVFITPILLLLRRKVNFFSSIATVMAIIALLLMFGGNAEGLFGSAYVFYLVIADVCFAAYVVGVSILGEGEESSALTFAQMCFAAVFSFIGWVVEALMGRTTLTLPTDTDFWISVIFIGVFIRVVYGLLQISCQKHVSAISASLLFSTEIIITMLMDPILCRLLGTEHTPATSYQVIGAILLIIATLLVDDSIISHLGYDDMNEPSVSKKMIVNTIAFSMITLVLSTIISFSAIYLIRDSAVSGSKKLGDDAAHISASAMISELENNTMRQAADKAKLAEQKLATYSNAVSVSAKYATALYQRANNYPQRTVEFAREENAGKWTMQLLLADKSIRYEDIEEESRLLGNMEDIFVPIVGDLNNVLTIYLGTEDGMMISYDRDSQLAVGDQYYEYRDSGWYNLGKSSNGCVFTDTYWDGWGRGLTITCVSPFYDRSGKFTGCVAMDILMADLNRSMVSEGIVDPVVATMIDAEGNIIASGDIDPDSQETFNVFDENAGSYLRPVAREILDKKNGIISTQEGSDAVYVTFATIESTDWTLCIASPVSNVIAPAKDIRESISTNTESVVSSVLQGVLRVIRSCLVLTAVILLVITLSAGHFSHRITDPLKELTADVNEISEGNLERRTSVSTDDEIGNLAVSFNHMTDSLQKYIADLKEVTAREERIAGELAVATKIQSSMLPKDFDAFSSHKVFDLYATMTPAKEVGGDFYDFFFTDDDHLGMVMADVSGKGVPAALFMVIAKTLIKNRALFGGSPGEVLKYANEMLCEQNEEELFVTVWMAIIEISTGKGIAANAGHEHPVIKRAGGKWELVEYRHSPAVATMSGLKFREHEFELYPGDSLFVYTDGVPEATRADNEMYGTDRMIDVLNRQDNASCEQLLASVKEDIDTFVEGADQFDDITMMTVSWRGQTG